MQKRLKHLKYNIEFFIQTNKQIQLERKIINNIDEFIILEKKYVLKNHTKENDIKKVEKKIEVEEFDDGYKINLFIHIHHYSKFYFNIDEYIYFLKELLNLNIIYPIEKKEIEKEQIEVKEKIEVKEEKNNLFY